MSSSTLVDYEVTEPAPSYLSPECETGIEDGCNPDLDVAVIVGTSDCYIGPERFGTRR